MINNYEAKMKVLFLINIPSPYRVEFFNRLSDRIDITVLYQRRSSSERSKKWRAPIQDSYTSIFLKGIYTGVDNALSLDVLNYINNSYDLIVICGNSSLTEILAMEWCKFKKIPYIVEGDGAFLDTSKTFKAKLKKHILKGASLYLSTCNELDKYYLAYGAKESQIKRYHFSSINKNDVLKEPLSKSEKMKLRKELDIVGDKIILSTGQFIYRKGFDILLKSMKSFDCGTSLYIIGGEPRKEYMEIIKNNELSNVYFKSFMTKEKLKKYYLASDIFVLPTREDIWGLVVNEAMAAALPVVTTERCNAGLEMLSNGKNGVIVPVDDVEALTYGIKTCLSKASEMSYETLKVISKYTLDQMVNDHVLIFNEWRSHNSERLN
ncbi:putative glycosyltransferase [Streptococcus porcinus]|uniref:glycosyltransferase family 4 protein n=1 Tax=Streptococcus porcinus TaxID=1340 RepID=UPI0010CACEDC|nr:glycosyltransferase family 4 protein [Streptococcus porcinus]VTS24309.1 putative glycosyltransferase [Streptococcus porcinus]